MYAKAHPFGYKPVKNQPNKEKGYRTPVQSIQVVTMKVPYMVADRDKTGEIVDVHEYHNTIQRIIKHYERKLKGRTLAEMVYSTINA